MYKVTTNLIDTKPAILWHKEIARRTLALWPFKAIGTTLFLTIFFNAYFAVLHNPSHPPFIMPLTPIDQWIPLSAKAFPVYVSLWVYVSLPPSLIASLRTLFVFGAWIAALCIGGLLLFWLFPTAVPATNVNWADYPEMAFLKGVDSTGNACPSLHVATAVFSALWLARLLQVATAPDWLRVLSALHCIAIIWSTLATRQHVFLDVLGGGFAGLLFGILSLIHASRTVGKNAW